MKKIKRRVILAIMVVSMLLMQCMTVYAAERIFKFSSFEHLVNVRSSDELRDGKDTPEGFCINGNDAYVTKIHDDGTTTIIKFKLNKPKKSKVMPAKNLSLGHANDMTYYNGYIYIAGFEDKKIYRVEDKGLNKNGKEKYEVKEYTMKGIDIKENSLNIAHLYGEYFIVCTKFESSRKLTYRIGYFNDSSGKFITKKTIYAYAKDYDTIQGLTFDGRYLYQSTFDKAGTKNKNMVSVFYIGNSFDEIIDNCTYSLYGYGKFNNTSLEKFEVESLDFKDGHLYVLTNIGGHKDPIYVSKKVEALPYDVLTDFYTEFTEWQPISND